MKVALVVPHIFMQHDILPNVIFSPGTLALDIAEGMQALGADVTLFTPGSVDTSVRNITADLSYFESELAARDDTYLELLKKHPLTFITLARQVQAELLADVFTRANAGEFDIVHVYTNEEEVALPFSKLCIKPVVFTHHDPFNFLVKYRSIFPKYKDNNWLSISMSQREGMPQDTNWLANIYHGLPEDMYHLNLDKQPYIAYIGRIIEAKGVHLAIKAILQYNELNPENPLTLKIAGKHYSGSNDGYWQEHIMPHLDNPYINYVGFIDSAAGKQELIGNAMALIIPSVFDEPFGMVMIEALACGTPVVGLNSGAIPEVIAHAKTGIVIDKESDEVRTIEKLAHALVDVQKLEVSRCRTEFEAQFTQGRMCQQHLITYEKLIK